MFPASSDTVPFGPCGPHGHRGGASVEVFEVAGLWQLALSQLEDLQRQKVEANVMTYNSAISAHRSDGHLCVGNPRYMVVFHGKSMITLW